MSQVDEQFDYYDGETLCKGRLIVPADGGARPGIVVYPDITGVGEHSIGKAKRLAEELGYVVLVADVYGNGSFPGFPQAGDVVASWISNPRDLARRAGTAIDALAADPRCNGRIGAIGFCFGGATVLTLVRTANCKLIAGVSFHGVLATPEVAQTDAPGKLLVCHGADDPFAGEVPLGGLAQDVKSVTLPEFLTEMSQAHVDCQVIAYAGVVHAFTIPDAGKFGTPGAAYNKAADERSWRAMADFFQETL